MININKERLLEIIAQNDFFVSEINIFGDSLPQVAFSYNDKTSRGIIVGEYKSVKQLKNINEDVYMAKEILKNLNYNTWNIYFLILFNQEEYTDKSVFNLERDSRNMRKYVILSIADLKRIPFLSSIVNQLEDTSEKLLLYGEIEKSEDKEINDFLFDLIHYKGEYKELSYQKIKEILQNNLNLGEKL